MLCIYAAPIGVRQEATWSRPQSYARVGGMEPDSVPDAVWSLDSTLDRAPRRGFQVALAAGHTPGVSDWIPVRGVYLYVCLGQHAVGCGAAQSD